MFVRQKPGIRKRHGATTVELAVVLPLIFLIFFSGWDISRVSMIRHTADNAVYEGCRVGILPGATADAVRLKTSQILSTAATNSAMISIHPQVIRSRTKNITVRVEVPLDANSFTTRHLFAGKTIVRELKMRREVP
ncbi:MAG: TadE family protein [Planctomycetaceae bacterium]